MSSCKKASASSKQTRISNLSSLSRPGCSKPKLKRKVLQSKKLPSTNSSHDGKSCSTGGIHEKKYETRKKFTKSDFIIKESKRSTKETEPVNYYYKGCRGDATSANSTQLVKDLDVETLVSMPRVPRKRTAIETGHVQQYYRNENFQPSTESIVDLTNAIKKLSLDPIQEYSERSAQPSQDTLLGILDSKERLMTFDDPDNENLEEIKEFRQKNYFECHSAKARIENKASVTSLRDHKCVYRFYLNDRLFPVPLCSDHNNEIRCIECLLPMNQQIGADDRINGTIQAKVTLGKKNQDVMILLPIREPLIIHEKRKEVTIDSETIYFGVVNLDKMGHSIFSRTLPGNSLALKYQKGYQEFENSEEYGYHNVDKDDVIVI